jgi:hypothetical protein
VFDRHVDARLVLAGVVLAGLDDRLCDFDFLIALDVLDRRRLSGRIRVGPGASVRGRRLPGGRGARGSEPEGGLDSL